MVMLLGIFGDVSERVVGIDMSGSRVPTRGEGSMEGLSDKKVRDSNLA